MVAHHSCHVLRQHFHCLGLGLEVMHLFTCQVSWTVLVSRHKQDRDSNCRDRDQDNNPQHQDSENAVSRWDSVSRLPVTSVHTISTFLNFPHLLFHIFYLCIIVPCFPVSHFHVSHFHRPWHLISWSFLYTQKTLKTNWVNVDVICDNFMHKCARGTCTSSNWLTTSVLFAYVTKYLEVELV